MTRALRLRLQYAREHRLDSLDAWRCTIFTDEAAVRSVGTVKSWVTCCKGEEYRKECLAAKMFSGQCSVMVWGAVWHGGRSKLVRFDCSQSEGKRKGVTAKIYAQQISKGELKRCWIRVTNSWHGVTPAGSLRYEGSALGAEGV